MTEIEQVEWELAWELYDRATNILQQGDLIRLKQEELPSIYGIVVTADCDLDKRKHSRLVTVVPFITLEEVICKCLAFDLFEQKSEELRAQCKTLLQLSQNPADASFIGGVKAFVREGIYASRKQEVLAKVVAHELSEIGMEDLKDIISLLGMSWSKTVDKFKQQVGSRGDLLLLTKPPLVSETPRVAWLRAIRQLPIADISLKTSESSGNRWQRVAQLKSPFRYRLTQMLGSVFADVGLPDMPKSSFESEFSLLVG